VGYPVSSLQLTNGGFPFGDKPNQWPVRGEVRDGQVHLVCAYRRDRGEPCGQSIFPLALALDQPGYQVTGDLLKSRIADHALRSHAADLGDTIRT
jgi:hypothetical protein